SARFKPKEVSPDAEAALRVASGTAAITLRWSAAIVARRRLRCATRPRTDAGGRMAEDGCDREVARRARRAAAVARQRSAKPLSGGSNPPGASPTARALGPDRRPKSSVGELGGRSSYRMTVTT